MFKPRYYQQDSIDALYAYFRQNAGNPLIAQPTGTGKSVVISSFIKGIYQKYPRQRLMMVTHVKELIEQNFEKLIKSWPTAPAGIYSAGLGRRDTKQKIIFAGIQSVVKKPELFGHIDLIIIDEAHLVSPKDETSYCKFIAALKAVNPYIKVIGLTATPYRLGLGLLTNGNIFDDICYNNTNLDGFNKLVDEGYLMPLIPKHTQTEIDVSEVGKSGGEFKQGELQKAVDKEEITYEAIQETIEHGQDRKHWLVFGTGTEHCDHIADMLESLGISAVAVHSKKPNAVNDKAIADFKAGRVRALVNNNKLTTGFDFPGIDLIAMIRHTCSPGLWVQMLGRGTRPVYMDGYDLLTIKGRLAAIQASHKQNCLVLDFAGNTKRLGPINDPLIPKAKGKKGNGGVAPVRMCEECGTYNHASVKVCINCGFEFPVGVNIYAQACSEALMASSKPKIVEKKITQVLYTRHRKLDRPDSILVTYYIGLATRYKEWICFEHGGYAGKQAREWWRRNAKDPEAELPPTTDDALKCLDLLKTPTYAKVWVNKKYPQIMSCTFKGEDDD